MIVVFKKYWWILFLIILVPWVINYIMIQPRICEITGNDTSWLSFWGGYIGSIISSSIALLILWQQLKQNHQENDDNRKLQLNNIKYQQKNQWLNLLRSKLADYYYSFCFHDLTFLEVKIYEKGNRNDIRNEIKVMYDRMSNAYFSVGIFFPENIDSEEKKMLSEIKKITERFHATLSDLDWYILTFANLSGSFELNKGFCKNKTEEYERFVKSDLSHDRIWNFIKENGYNIFDKQNEIVSTYLDAVFNVLNPDNVQEDIANLIDYEQNKIDKILS